MTQFWLGGALFQIPLVVLFGAALVLGALRERSPSAPKRRQGFVWGYANGYFALLLSAWMLLNFFVFLSNPPLAPFKSDGQAFAFLGVMIAITIVGIFALKRYRFAHVLIALTGTPIYWIFYGHYLWRRWVEMKSFGAMWEGIGFWCRFPLAVTIFWGMIVFLFNFLFEPFGPTLRDDEWMKLIVAALAPAALIVLGRILHNFTVSAR